MPPRTRGRSRGEPQAAPPRNDVYVGLLIISFLGLDGQTNWFEGVLLLALYAVLGIAFFYIPSNPFAH